MVRFRKQPMPGGNDASHRVNDRDEVIAFIEQAEQAGRQLQISPGDVAAALQSNIPPRLIDVRTSEEWKLARIRGATLNTEDLAQEMLYWPNDRLIVFYCHFGQRSLDAASYFAGHGFSNVRMMTGGIDAWSLSVDSSVPRYEVSLSDGKAMLRTFRSVVSKATGGRRQVRALSPTIKIEVLPPDFKCKIELPKVVRRKEASMCNVKVPAVSSVDGAKIASRSGNDLGKIEDLMLDVQQNRIAYEVLSFKGFLGMGEKGAAAPWEVLELDAKEKRSILDESKDRLESASGFDRKECPDFADRPLGSEK